MKNRRFGRLEAKAISGNRMNKPQNAGMKCKPIFGIPYGSIIRITGNGVSAMRQLDTDLVFAPGNQFNFNQV
jgi:hypothetical protein